jgi:putative PIN family toxin of toxin-antitoxin system
VSSERYKIVIDTNVLLSSIPKKSEYRWLIDKIVDDEIDVFITNDILMEYEEVLEKKANRIIKNLTIDFLLNAENVYKIFSYHKLNIMTTDPDDNKFIDCAYTSGADFIISHDKHFNILENIPFPRIKVISIEDFKKLFS